MFGSSGLANTDGRLVMESFLRRGPLDFDKNDHVKTFVRPERVLRCVTPHVLDTGSTCFDVSGEPIAWIDPDRAGRSKRILHGEWRLHHYFVRSQAHWRRRMLRGQRGIGVMRLLHELEQHDRNDESDDRALPFAARVRAYMQANDIEIGRPVPVTEVAAVKCCIDVIKDGCIGGWAIDSSGAKAPRLRFLIDGEEAGRLTPSRERPDVERSGMAAISRCGFVFGVPLRFRDGKPHRLEVTDQQCARVFLEVKAVPYAWLPFELPREDEPRVDADTPEPPSGGPLVAVDDNVEGHMDRFSDEGGGGWAISKQDPGTPVRLEMVIDGAPIGALICDLPRPDLQALFGTSKAGFAFDIPGEFRDGRPHTLRLVTARGWPVSLHKDGRSTTDFRFQSTRAAPKDKRDPIICVLDEFSPTNVRGWAIDALRPGVPVRLHVLIDCEEVFSVTCDSPRGDVEKAAGFFRRCGYEFAIPERFLDGESHRVEFRVRSGKRAPLTFVMNGEQRDHLTFSERFTSKRFSSVDGVENGAIKGWVLREDPESGELQGGCTVAIYCGEEPLGYAKADRWRPDVGAEKNGDAYCGFRFQIPSEFRRGQPQTFHVRLLPENVELTGSPVVCSIVSDETVKQLCEVRDVVDRLYTDVTALRQTVRSLLPRKLHTLDDYDDWGRAYQTALRRRIETTRGEEQNAVLVSVICPTYRPRLRDFAAAVESVFAQTHENWELIIADDGSEMPELDSQIEAFCRRDSRVKAVRCERNGGISRATNAALGVARGTWIVLFDHDDLLVDVALEVMLRGARATGAEVLYADEDKIDEGGRYCEPALKPDFNYRLLLSNNYICHLLMVRRDTLQRVGMLDYRYDGSQDYDLVLRLSEKVDHRRIIHVPEILYHWRKTANSTAAAVSSKTYTIKAGQSALAAHLRRRRLPCKVTNLLGATFYQVHWRFSREPKVRVIIPFKDQAQMTQRCVDSLLSTTAYGNYEVVLVDNWSTSAEVEALRRSTLAADRVRVLRVEEPFNYSRLNNLAVRDTDAEFVVLMNNDVLHTDPHWLRAMINEALADAQVAIVGCKLLYPNGTVQHAGVILGMWGVAGHMNAGLAGESPGYCGRAAIAQELSAVTGACMLIRAPVYRELGGLDESDLTVAFNDIDFCLKAASAGYKIVWTPHVVAEHHESLSRGEDTGRAKEARFFLECQVMSSRWGELLKRDPHYSRHFDLDRQPFFDLRDPACEPPPVSGQVWSDAPTEGRIAVLPVAAIEDAQARKHASGIDILDLTPAKAIDEARPYARAVRAREQAQQQKRGGTVSAPWPMRGREQDAGT
jgi:GT2 family glycosyltransferase